MALQVRRPITPRIQCSKERRKINISRPTRLHLAIITLKRNMYEFSSVPGFFEDYAKIAKSLPNGKISTQPALGIIERDYDGLSIDPVLNNGRAQQWTRFAKYLDYLNEKHASEGISYKLMYVIRHGRGFHNVKMDEVKRAEADGTIETVDGKPLNWKNYWAHMDGDGQVVWADSHLVDEGIAQAQKLAKLWLDEAEKDALPLPGTIYTSPLARCLQTTQLAYTPVLAQHGKALRPIIKETLRERITDHTCDRRSSRSWIEQNYPNYIIEEGFTESDESWDPNSFETLEEHIARIQQLLDDIFTNDTSPIISLTTHSYAMTAILALLGYDKFMVNEGTLVPILVKAKKIT
ncbi:phosphoglycerate mutase-like protein [Hypomontagnella submonticulosa]|nr:phosphoglycerate mutase-like protein [Hypomontagnella submonticulosa]